MWRRFWVAVLPNPDAGPMSMKCCGRVSVPTRPHGSTRKVSRPISLMSSTKGKKSLQPSGNRQISSQPLLRMYQRLIAKNPNPKARPSPLQDDPLGAAHTSTMWMWHILHRPSEDDKGTVNHTSPSWKWKKKIVSLVTRTLPHARWRENTRRPSHCVELRPWIFLLSTWPGNLKARWWTDTGVQCGDRQCRIFAMRCITWSRCSSCSTQVTSMERTGTLRHVWHRYTIPTREMDGMLHLL